MGENRKAYTDFVVKKEPIGRMDEDGIMLSKWILN
jgi:hypothetical protein